MPNTQQEIKTTFIVQEDGSFEKIEEIVEIEVQSTEEIIADKEAQLLEIYSEIQQLKGE